LKKQISLAIKYQYSDISLYSPAKKTIVSVLFGLACLLFINFGITMTIGKLGYTIPWSIVFPLMIALAYGKSYGLISGLSGAAFYGFVLWPKEGIANGLIAIFFLILLILAGSISEKNKEQSNQKAALRFVVVIAYVIGGLAIVYVLYNPVLSLNAYMNSESMLTEFHRSILFNFWIKDLINFSFLIVAAELFLTLGFVRKLLGLPVNPAMKKNTLVFFQSLVGAFLIWIIFVALSKTLIESSTQKHNTYISLALLTFLWSSFVVARLLIRNVNRHLIFQKQLAEQNKEYITLNKQLKLSKEKAEQSDKLKTAFLTNITHEIRTPLNGILGFSSLLEAEVQDKQHKRYAELIIKSSNRLLLTINDVLDIAKIEAGEMSLNLESIDVKSLCKELYDFYNEQNLNIDFKLELPEAAEIIIRTDRTKLYQILNNLLGNAVKFTESGYVKLGCEKTGKNITFCIEDSGVGISAEEKKLIFQRFRQSDRLKQSKNAGTGLGLAIAKEFTELLGGEIWFESEHKKGTKFYVKLPLHK